MAQIFTSLIGSIGSQIAGLTPSGGYNFTYSAVDVRSQARTYPAVLLSFPEDEGRLGSDTLVDKITVETDLKLTVLLSSTETATSRDDGIDKATDDIKKMFNAKLTTFQGVGLIDYDYKGSERRYTLNPARPAEVDVLFGLNWRQSRITPSST